MYYCYNSYIFFQVKLVTDAGLIIFCWGDDNNNTDTIKYLKQLGLHGVIYDKLDQYSTKEVKVCWFIFKSTYYIDHVVVFTYFYLLFIFRKAYLCWKPVGLKKNSLVMLRQMEVVAVLKIRKYCQVLMSTILHITTTT